LAAAFVFLPRRLVGWVWSTLLRKTPHLRDAVLRVFEGRLTGMGLVALHLVGLVVVAATIFGDTRLRAPYDPLILLLAVELYATVGWVVVGFVRERFMRSTAGSEVTAVDGPVKPPK
jgi:hypothetical protein